MDYDVSVCTSINWLVLCLILSYNAIYFLVLALVYTVMIHSDILPYTCTGTYKYIPVHSLNLKRVINIINLKLYDNIISYAIYR
jgi:hypothetical protein